MQPLLWFTLTAFLASAVSDDLVFLQTVWRHGDRTPTYTCKGDPNTEDKWIRYGGFGQLTPTGMQQHIGLGDLMYRKYVVQQKFLSEKYRHDEIYVRSTDLNRTMISAMSNMIGMYYNRGNITAGYDYPSEGVKWPPHYIPVPIHTVRNFDDYVMNPDAVCPRQNMLWKMATETLEWKNLTDSNKGFMEFLSGVCQEHLDMADDLWKIKDAFMIENIYNLTLPVNQSVFQEILRINNEIENMQNGMDVKPYKGIDFQSEIGKIRGGGLLWDMIDHIDLKLHCLDPVNKSECIWMNKVKYYAYSAHDTTVGALLAVLKAKAKIIQQGGYPSYSSAVAVELHKNGDDVCLKFFFHRNFSLEFEDITKAVETCENADCCPYIPFRENAKKYYPSTSEAKLCQNLNPEATSFDPDDRISNRSPKLISRSTKIKNEPTKQTNGALRLFNSPMRALLFASALLLISKVLL